MYSMLSIFLFICLSFTFPNVQSCWIMIIFCEQSLIYAAQSIFSFFSLNCLETEFFIMYMVPFLLHNFDFTIPFDSLSNVYLFQYTLRQLGNKQRAVSFQLQESRIFSLPVPLIKVIKDST